MLYSTRKGSEIPRASGNVSNIFTHHMSYITHTRLIVIRIDPCISRCTLLQYSHHRGELQGAHHAVPVEHRLENILYSILVCAL